MLKLRPLKPYRITVRASTMVAVLILYMALAAQTPETSSPASSVKDVFGYILGGVGVISLIVGLVWGMINRKNYDKLKETIDDLEESCESKERRIAELRLTCTETEAKLLLQVTQIDATCTGLKVSNLAIVSQNLQMKAILRQLRLTGKWEGHEDNVFNQAKE